MTGACYTYCGTCGTTIATTPEVRDQARAMGLEPRCTAHREKGKP